MRLLRWFSEFLDWLPGSGTPWTPSGRRKHFGEKRLISNTIALHDRMEEAMKLADDDRRQGLPRPRPQALAAAGGVIDVVSQVEDSQAYGLATSWREAFDAYATAWPVPDDAAATWTELEVKARQLNRHMGSLLGRVIDAQLELLARYAVREAQIGVADLTFDRANLDISRWKQVRVWRLEGFYPGVLPGTIHSGGLYDVWIPTDKQVALTGQGALTAEVTGSGDNVETKLTVEGTTRFRLE